MQYSVSLAVGDNNQKWWKEAWGKCIESYHELKVRKQQHLDKLRPVMREIQRVGIKRDLQIPDHFMFAYPSHYKTDKGRIIQGGDEYFGVYKMEPFTGTPEQMEAVENSHFSQHDIAYCLSQGEIPPDDMERMSLSEFFQGKELRRLYYGSQMPATNCFGMTFANGEGGSFSDTDVRWILEDNGYQKIMGGDCQTEDAVVSAYYSCGYKPGRGDVVVYYQDVGQEMGTEQIPIHSGVISRIVGDTIFVVSKLGDHGLYEHTISSVSAMGPSFEIYHTDRKGKRLVVKDLDTIHLNGKCIWKDYDGYQIVFYQERKEIYKLERGKFKQATEEELRLFLNDMRAHYDLVQRNS